MGTVIENHINADSGYESISPASISERAETPNVFPVFGEESYGTSAEAGYGSYSVYHGQTSENSINVDQIKPEVLSHDDNLQTNNEIFAVIQITEAQANQAAETKEVDAEIENFKKESNPKAVKRARTQYSPQQILTLEYEYKLNRYLSRPKRIKLSHMLNLTEKTITVWFQNRRMKEKRNFKNGSLDTDNNTLARSFKPTGRPPKSETQMVSNLHKPTRVLQNPTDSSSFHHQWYNESGYPITMDNKCGISPSNDVVTTLSDFLKFPTVQYPGMHQPNSYLFREKQQQLNQQHVQNPLCLNGRGQPFSQQMNPQPQFGLQHSVPYMQYPLNHSYQQVSDILLNQNCNDYLAQQYLDPQKCIETPKSQKNLVIEKSLEHQTFMDVTKFSVASKHSMPQQYIDSLKYLDTQNYLESISNYNVQQKTDPENYLACENTTQKDLDSHQYMKSLEYIENAPKSFSAHSMNTQTKLNSPNYEESNQNNLQYNIKIEEYFPEETELEKTITEVVSDQASKLGIQWDNFDVISNL